MRNLALASLHLLLTGRYGSSRRAPGISFRRRVPDTLVVWMLAHRLCVGTAPHYSIRSLILCGTIRASGLGRERRGGRPRTFWVLSGVGGVSSLFDDLFTMAAGHSLDADRVTHASERYGRLLFVVCCFDTAVRTAMKRRIPKCLLENSIASCVLFCQYAGLGRNRHGDSRAVSRERPSLVQRDRRGSRPLGTSRLRSRHTAPRDGIINHFTINVDRSRLRAGVPILVKARSRPSRSMRYASGSETTTPSSSHSRVPSAAILWILRGNESCRRRALSFLLSIVSESIRRATSASRRRHVTLTSVWNRK